MAKINKIVWIDSILFQIVNFTQISKRFGRFLRRQIPLRHGRHFKTDHKFSNRGRSFFGLIMENKIMSQSLDQSPACACINKNLSDKPSGVQQD